MKGNLISLTELAQEVERQDSIKQDYLVPADNISLKDDNTVGLLFRKDGTNGDYNYDRCEEFIPTEHFHSQLASKLEIPKRYYDKIAEIPGLRRFNVNSILGYKPENSKYLVRTLDGKARAFLSNKFKPMDNYFVLSAFLPVLKEFNDLEIRSQVLTEKRMYLQISVPSLQAEVMQGDVVQAGITLTNSEVGAGALDVKSLIWRLVCKNGMIAGSLLRKYHVGKRIDSENMDIFADDTIQAELVSYQKRLRDVVRYALTESVFNEQVEKLRNASGDKIVKPQATIENVTKRFGLSKDAGESILSNMGNEGSMHRYGLANGITALAHSIENRDNQYEMEKIGYQVIDLKPSEWEVLNVA